jgi:hypothetical protein
MCVVVISKQRIRIQNVECNFNGFQEEQKDFDLLRNCVKSILDENRAMRLEEKRKGKIIKH